MPFIISLARMMRGLRSKRGRGIVAVLILVAICIVGNAVTFAYFDGKTSEVNFVDGLWYSVISITTIGYGDHSATTLGARLGTLFFIVILGLAVFTIFVSMVIDTIASAITRSAYGLGRANTMNHIVIVNIPSATRLQRVIRELQHDADHANREIVVISDQVEQLPPAVGDVLFVHGSPLSPETYDRADLARADMVLVLSTGAADAGADAMAASAVAVVRSIRKEVRIVAECSDDQHRHLFESVGPDAIVPGVTLADNLLVQEIADPGVAEAFGVMAANSVGDTLYSTAVPDPAPTQSYAKIAAALLDHDINLLAIVRQREVITRLRNTTPMPNDRLIYIADARQTWQQLAGCL